MISEELTDLRSALPVVGLENLRLSAGALTSRPQMYSNCGYHTSLED